MKTFTFVLLTCGELTEDACREAINPFLSEIDFKVIRNVFPQVKALNTMIDIVETDFFVALDADMVLYPDAWQRIKKAQQKHAERSDWHTILFPLWDTLTGRRILALKVMRTKVFKETPFSDTPTPDVEHYQRLASLGYVSVDDYLDSPPIGDHVVKGDFFCYQKYFDVYQTIRKHNNFVWDSGVFMGGESILEKAKRHFDFFYKKWLLTTEPDNLSCIAGIYDGLTMPLKNRSKDLSNGCRRTPANHAPDLMLELLSVLQQSAYEHS